MSTTLAILGSLKGKVLDVHHIELLKDAYEKQDENIKQLKLNNEAIREQSELIKGQLQDRDARIREFEQEVQELTSKLEAAQGQIPKPPENLDAECEAILQYLAERPHSDIWNDDLASALRKPITMIDHHLDLLEEGDYVYRNYNFHREGSSVSLASRGRAYAVQHDLIK
jgi:DNA-binding transcriptional ArsR family regulator